MILQVRLTRGNKKPKKKTTSPSAQGYYVNSLNFKTESFGNDVLGSSRVLNAYDHVSKYPNSK